MVRVKIVKVRYNVKVSYVLQQLAWSRPDWFWILGQPRPLNTTCAYNVTAYLCICQLKFKTTAPVDYRCMLHTDVYSIIVFFVFEKHQSGDRKIGSRHCVIADWWFGVVVTELVAWFHINKVKLCWARLVLGFVTAVPLAGTLSRYFPGQSGPLSLAIPLWVGSVSTDSGFGHNLGRNGKFC